MRLIYMCRTCQCVLARRHRGLVTQSGGTLTPLRVYLFGHFRVDRQEKVVRLPTRHTRSLLAYLILHPGPHSREKLAALFWPEVPDDSARTSLRNALYTLRRKLGRQLLQADRQTAQINSSFPLWVDALTFKTQATRFLNGPSPDPNAVNLELYTGQLLDGFYDDWVLVEREAFRNLYLETLLDLTQRMRSQSEYERAVEFAEIALACDRANERAHQHMIVCHVALGNRGAALSQYEACRSALRDELAVEPSAATKKLHEWIQQAPAERLPVEAALTNLPIPLTTFIGRRGEIAGVKKLLSSGRLLTLTGAGGSGKTRLAIQVASDLLDVYIDGVWWVELAPLADGNLLPRAVAKALGAPEVPRQKTADTLVNFLRPKNLLLVLDNCEHLIAASARLVNRLLSGFLA
jgi:DNA-binding SARP family transcriptional activator